MKKMLLSSRYRLLVNLLALALTLCALAVTPAVADENSEPEMGGGGTWTCEAACWNWNAQTGCTNWQECCSNTDGRWFCRPLPR